VVKSVFLKTTPLKWFYGKNVIRFYQFQPKYLKKQKNVSLLICGNFRAANFGVGYTGRPPLSNKKQQILRRNMWFCSKLLSFHLNFTINFAPLRLKSYL